MKKIRTMSSTYLLGDGFISRLPNETVEDGWQQAILRRDGDRLELVEIEGPVVGQRMRMVVKIREDGVLTVRQTTPVVSIEELT